MNKQKLMAVAGIAIAAGLSIALRHWGTNKDLHDLIDLARDVLPVLGFTLPVSLMSSAPSTGQK